MTYVAHKLVPLDSHDMEKRVDGRFYVFENIGGARVDQWKEYSFETFEAAYAATVMLSTQPVYQMKDKHWWRCEPVKEGVHDKKE